MYSLPSYVPVHVVFRTSVTAAGGASIKEEASQSCGNLQVNTSIASLAIKSLISVHKYNSKLKGSGLSMMQARPRSQADMTRARRLIIPVAKGLTNLQ